MSVLVNSSIASPRPPTARLRPARIALWVLQIALAALFFMAGTSKLAGAAAMVQLFDAIGIGQWFRYVTGALEVIGAILLVVPAFAALGAVLLAAIMFGAIVSHVAILHTAPVPLPLFVGLLIIVFVRRAEIAALLARLRR
ncbi:MAG: DoxX family protein [Gemmatimonadetes bacterium]|nr:MAG: DoxX family protein [Gemmatimonadota bacterium]PHX96677.1 MAG: DoxX family protein [Gemmatimonadota bacterium]